MILISFIQKGGFLMIPIIGVMFAGFYLVLERYFYLKKNKTLLKKMNAILPKLESNDRARLIEELSLGHDCMSHLLTVGAEYLDMDEEILENRLKQVFYEEINGLQKNLATLQIIATVLPLLGLLGTVTGMIAVFKAIAVIGVGDPNALAGGISQALITTQTGIAGAIPILFAHHFLSGSMEHIVLELKRAATTTLNICKHRKKNLGGSVFRRKKLN